MDPSEKDALTYVPGAGLTLAEQMGTGGQVAALHPYRRNDLGTGTSPAGEHERVHPAASSSRTCKSRRRSSSRICKPWSAPASGITILPFKVRADYIKMTDSTILTTVTIEL